MVMATLEKTVLVGLGEIQVSADPATTLACVGLGSCIGLCCHDPLAGVAGVAHIVLPDSAGHNVQSSTATKFADLAVPALLGEMQRLGAARSRITARLTGGAQMLQALGIESPIEMGARNTEMTKRALAREGIAVTAMDLGGGKGRSLWLEVGSGRLTVRSVGMTPREL